jgi:hypothetical protein
MAHTEQEKVSLKELQSIIDRQILDVLELGGVVCSVCSFTPTKNSLEFAWFASCSCSVNRVLQERRALRERGVSIRECNNTLKFKLKFVETRKPSNTSDEKFKRVRPRLGV